MPRTPLTSAQPLPPSPTEARLPFPGHSAWQSPATNRTAAGGTQRARGSRWDEPPALITQRARRRPGPSAGSSARGAAAALTRSDASSSSVRLADWARSHRSITRGSSNSGGERGDLRGGAAAPATPAPARPTRHAHARQRAPQAPGALPGAFSAEATGPAVLVSDPPSRRGAKGSLTSWRGRGETGKQAGCDFRRQGTETSWVQPPHAAQAPSPPHPSLPGARGGRGARLTGAGAVALVADPAQPVEALAQAAQPVLQLRVPAAQHLLAHAAPVHRADGVLLRVCGAGGTAAAGRPFPAHTAALGDGTRPPTPPPASTRPRCATEVTPEKLRAPLQEGQPTAAEVACR